MIIIRIPITLPMIWTEELTIRTTPQAIMFCTVDLYSPTKTGYEFLGWMRDYTNPQITLSALNHNYNYYNVLNNIEPGTEYEITIGTAKTTAGSSSMFSCVIYDFTDSKCFVQKNIAFGSNISFSVTCPASADTNHDIRLLFYSGVAGSTSGIASVYSNVNINRFSWQHLQAILWFLKLNRI